MLNSLKKPVLSIIGADGHLIVFRKVSVINCSIEGLPWGHKMLGCLGGGLDGACLGSLDGAYRAIYVHHIA